MGRVLEICCDSLESAVAAQAGGADRIELCSELECDGLTPDAALTAAVLAAVRIPVFVMIRPRAGDFVYPADELDAMAGELARAKEQGAAGIVSGVLTAGGSPDLEATARLVAAAGELPFTFHRAFDEVAEPLEALRNLADAGVARVLTSGGGKKADGAKLQAYQEAERRLTILACGGVRSANVEAVVSCPGLTEFHSAALSATGGRVVDEGEVRAMAAVIHRA